MNVIPKPRSIEPVTGNLPFDAPTLKLFVEGDIDSRLLIPLQQQLDLSVTVVDSIDDAQFGVQQSEWA